MFASSTDKVRQVAMPIWRLITLFMVLALLMGTAGNVGAVQAERGYAAPTTPGTLDTTFGKGGKVTTDFGSDNDAAHAMVIQPDGKIVVAGMAWPLPDAKPRFALARYNKDGSLDKSFGKGGKVITRIVDSADDYSVAKGMALQSDGKLVVVGYASNPKVSHVTFAVARYNRDGSLDTRFGTKGRILTPITEAESYSWQEEANAVAIAPDGKIVVAGGTGQYLPNNIAVVRYTAAGKLDTGFGKGGIVLTDSGNGDDVARSVAVQPDGKVVVAGNFSPGGGKDHFGLVRYNKNGTPDSSFGNTGIVSTGFVGDKAWGHSMLLLPGGKIVMTGYLDRPDPCNYCSKRAFGLVQYTKDGKLDASFGNGGKTEGEFIYSASGYAITRLKDGRLVVAGTASTQDFGLAVYKANGKLDTRYGDKGLVTTNFGGNIDSGDHIYAVAAQADGKIVAAGVAATDEHGIKSDFALVRYLGD